jgi:hypothetical protein
MTELIKIYINQEISFTLKRDLTMLNLIAFIPTIASIGLFGPLSEALGLKVVAGVVSFGAGYFISSAAKTTIEDLIKGAHYIQAQT